jgi:putative transcriptional regulator
METMDAQELRRVFSRRVRERRKELGLTQVDLAKKLGVSQPVVAYVEAEEDKSSPGIDLIARVAEALQTSPSALLSSESSFSPVPT